MRIGKVEITSDELARVKAKLHSCDRVETITVIGWFYQIIGDWHTASEAENRFMQSQRRAGVVKYVKKEWHVIAANG